MTKQERIEILEKQVKDLFESQETIAELMDGYQKKLQRSITELSEHFMHSMEPKIKKIVRDEIEQS